MNIRSITYFSVIFLFLLLYGSAFAQYTILEDKGAATKVHQAIDSIYDLNFDAADLIIAELESTLGNYPGVLLLKAFYVNWKYRPIKKDHKSYAQFESYLRQGIVESEAILEKDNGNMEANFFLLACHGFLAELYANNGQNFKGLGEAKDAYGYIKLGFDHTKENPEFYFSSGIYNYYREKYPEENPFYKSFLWFFRDGDMDEGIAMLKKGSRLAVFTQAECYTYLFHIYLRYEDNPKNAIEYAQILMEKYPHNLHYRGNFIENEIRLGNYDDLYPNIELLLKSGKAFYQYLGEIYYGIYLEKSKKNYAEALAHYKAADRLGNKDDVRVPHYDSILFLGMGRINRINGNENEARQYFKQSVKSAEYSAYRKDAELLLEN